MILEGLMRLLDVVFDALDALIPNVPMPDAFDDLGAYSNYIGSVLFMLNGLLPISEYLVFLTWVLGFYYPVAVTFSLTRWAYSHLPVIGKGDG